MCEGRFAVFVIKGESPSNLRRVAEILREDEELAKVWYYVDRTVKNDDNAEMALCLRRLVPEWCNCMTREQVVARSGQFETDFKGSESRQLGKRMGSFAKGDIGIVLASFAMHSDGEIPDVQVGKVEKWLRHRSKSDE